MKLGQKVIVWKESKFLYDNQYDDETDRAPAQKIRVDEDLEKPIEGYIVRRVFKITGRYNAGWQDSDGDYYPPYLDKTERHEVYEVAYSLFRKPILVALGNFDLRRDV